jgi:hypothetical protein
MQPCLGSHLAGHLRGTEPPHHAHHGSRRSANGLSHSLSDVFHRPRRRLDHPCRISRRPASSDDDHHDRPTEPGSAHHPSTTTTPANDDTVDDNTATALIAIAAAPVSIWPNPPTGLCSSAASRHCGLAPRHHEDLSSRARFQG